MSKAVFEAGLSIGRTEAEFDIIVHFTDGPAGAAVDAVMVGDTDIFPELEQSVIDSIIEEIQDYKRFDIVDQNSGRFS